MKFKEKVKESIVSRAAEGIATSLSVILLWAVYNIAPVIMPALDENLSKRLLLSLFLVSMALNIVFALLFWATRKKPDLKLKYGIYWDEDKNPHCPNCKIPIAGYAEYHAGTGYYCKPCKKIFPLQDSAGNDILPSQAVSEL